MYMQVDNVSMEIVEGDPRNVLCDAVERNQAPILVLGSHGYGVVKRYIYIYIYIYIYDSIPIPNPILIAIQLRTI
jgi:hypothetical protein